MAGERGSVRQRELPAAGPGRHYRRNKRVGVRAAGNDGLPAARLVIGKPAERPERTEDHHEKDHLCMRKQCKTACTRGRILPALRRADD